MPRVRARSATGAGSSSGAEPRRTRTAPSRFLYVIESEPRDRGGPLGVEEQQQAGEAAFGLEGVLVQEAALVAQRASSSPA
ncbi:hypothetical protein [Streptomyces diacarni]|nr:hypothetical protein [Streptomyces diacarni]